MFSDILPYIAIGLMVGGAASIIGELVQKLSKATKGKDQTLETRVEALTASLTDATQLISQIQREIESRSGLATKLREDVERYDQLKKISAPEVEAVAQLLRGELKSEARKSFWKGVIVNFIFFILGAVSSYLLSRIGHQ